MSRGRGVLSRGSACSPPRSCQTSLPPPGGGSSPLNHSCLVTRRLPASARAEDNPLVPPFFFFLSARLRTHVTSNAGRRRPKMKRWRRSGRGGRLTGGSCQLCAGSQRHVCARRLWHLFKRFRNSNRSNGECRPLPRWKHHFNNAPYSPNRPSCSDKESVY